MHAEAFLRQMDATATRITAETRSKLAAEYEVITEGFKFLNSIFQAEVGYSDSEQQSADILKTARTMTLLRMTNSLQAAFMLQERGFPAESLSLCRDGLELVFIWKHLEAHPADAQKWFDSAHDAKSKFNFAESLRALGDYDRVYPTYQRLCKFCHPTGMTFWTGLQITPSEYSFSWRKFCCAHILKVINETIGVVLQVHGSRLFRDEKPLAEWQARAQTCARQLKNDFASAIEAAVMAVEQLKGT